MRILSLIISLVLISPGFASIYTWKDASGRTVYGDNPPEKGKVMELNPEPLTIVPGFKDPDAEESTTSSSNPDIAKQQKELDEKSEEEEDKPPYDSFKIAYPSSGEEIRSNDGTLSISLELSPALAEEDYIFIYVNGKKLIENSKSLSIDLSNLDRGSHSMFAVVRNDKGHVLLNSNTVTFNILRNSAILNRRR